MVYNQIDVGFVIGLKSQTHFVKALNFYEKTTIIAILFTEIGDFQPVCSTRHQGAARMLKTSVT